MYVSEFGRQHGIPLFKCFQSMAASSENFMHVIPQSHRFNVRFSIRYTRLCAVEECRSASLSGYTATRGERSCSIYGESRLAPQWSFEYIHANAL